MAYITGNLIRSLREQQGITQKQLADQLSISDKTVSKWETGRGLPDISILPELAQALHVSLTELLSGNIARNGNLSGNLRRMGFYVCPVCGNVIHSTGNALVSCCGIVLPALEAEEADEEHPITVEPVEDEHFITVHHPMTKEHFISFAAFVTCDRLQLVKLYPEGEAQTRMQLRGRGFLYYYCNRHGLFRKRI